MSIVETDDGARLFTLDWGSGPPLIFLHGWSLCSDVWEYQTAALARAGFRCIAYDRRGHGRSSDPGTRYDFDRLADDLAAVLESKDVGGATLIGHSMGAGEIVRYLSRHGSSRVSRIVLVAPVTPCLLRRDDNPAGLDGGFFDMLLAALAGDRQGFLRAGMPGFFGSAGTGVSPAMQEWVLGMALAASPLAASECVRAYANADFRAELAGIEVPTVVIHGDADDSAPLALTGHPTAAGIPGAMLRIYEGAPHGLMLTERDRFTRELAELVLA